MKFEKAERAQARLRCGIAGPSGAGKTFSALLIAQGLGGKIAMIDTEHRSGSLYADKADYDILSLSAPYTPERYREGIVAAGEGDYNVLIIDGLSHAWAGEGGMLEMHDMATAKSGNSYTAWRDVTPEHNKLVEAILASKMHVIVTLRSKTAYEIFKDDGKTKVKKLGLAPIFREGIEYEFTVMFDLSVEKHIASASKDRTGLFDGKNFVITKATGEELFAWLGTGVDPEEKSKTLMNELLKDMKKVGSLPELADWWVGHKEAIADLSDEHRAVVVAHKDTMKTRLSKKDMLLKEDTDE